MKSVWRKLSIDIPIRNSFTSLVYEQVQVKVAQEPSGWVWMSEQQVLQRCSFPAQAAVLAQIEEELE